ncbi:hypothetical protein [Spirosoma sordidisoli]|uniref:Uncharacterized protein n=1 Tax=Spirosoma sordidisoli TaxID=2502893 RepID=A0A4Q2UML7_9BACT|nr:hypothetical protein [Spirosoma sordidisoli]RYC70873.1 hypothetical protein EQG79_01595 [Spirosoma sordidisoli]
MLDTVKLTNELTGVVGLYSGFQSGADLVGSQHADPQLFLSDAHKLLRPDILAALGPNVVDFVALSYEANKTYKQHDLVSDSGTLYQSVRSANTGQPLTDTDYWQETTPLSAWYGRIERGAIRKLAMSLASAPPAQPVLERQPLYNKEGNLAGKLTKSNRFLALRVSVADDIALMMLRAALQVTGPLAGLPIYVFHSSSPEPVAAIGLTGNSSGRSIWNDGGTVLTSLNDGYYLIGYFEADLPIGVQAVGAERGFSPAGCSSCLGSDYALAQGRQRLVDIRPVYVENADEPGVMTWNEEDENDVTRQTWGLNLIIEARCSVTATLIQNKEMLTHALLYVIACDVLEEISTSDRVNGLAAQFRNEAYVALNGQNSAKYDIGLRGEKDRLLADLKKVMQRVSPCMKAEAPRRGIRFENMYD